jgi:hypothetical protein
VQVPPGKDPVAVKDNNNNKKINTFVEVVPNLSVCPHVLPPISIWKELWNLVSEGDIISCWLWDKNDRI